jgi:hypothetical protein
VARAAELESAGADPAAAATTAVRELGDIPALIAAVAADDPSAPAGSVPAAGARPDLTGAAELMRRHRVRPRPAFVLRTVVLGLVIAAAVVLLTLVALGLLAAGLTAGLVLAVVLGLAVGLVTADALRQETTVHFPSPRGRAAAWGVSGGLLAAGLGTGAVYVTRLDEVGVLIAAVVLTLAGILGLSWSGVTQTNRTKPWALEVGRQAMVADRFTQDPAAAARFGIYTVVVWIVGIALFVVLSLTVGFAWSWLAILATVAVFFLMLARMNFPAAQRRSGHDTTGAGRPMP